MCARQFVALHGRGRTRLKLDRFSAQRSSRPAVLLETEAMAFLRPLRATLEPAAHHDRFVDEHGTGKYLNFPVGPMNHASPLTAGGAAGVIELVAGVLL